jgi:hypothetical protein
LPEGNGEESIEEFSHRRAGVKAWHVEEHLETGGLSRSARAPTTLRLPDSLPILDINGAAFRPVIKQLQAIAIRFVALTSWQGTFGSRVDDPALQKASFAQQSREGNSANKPLAVRTQRGLTRSEKMNWRSFEMLTWRGYAEAFSDQ